MSLLSGIPNCRAEFGSLAALGLLAYRVTGRPKMFRISDPNLRFPVYARHDTPDQLVFNVVIRNRKYELPSDFSPQVIVDSAANVGYTSAYFANRYPAARIIALEPEPGNFQMLLRNTRRYPQITCLNAILWSDDGELNFFAGTTHGNQWSFRTSEGKGTRAIGIDSLMSSFDIAHIDLLRIDIEETERKAFESASWLDRVSVLAAEFHDRFNPGWPHLTMFVVSGIPDSSDASTRETSDEVFYSDPTSDNESVGVTADLAAQPNPGAQPKEQVPSSEG